MLPIQQVQVKRHGSVEIFSWHRSGQIKARYRVKPAQIRIGDIGGLRPTKFLVEYNIALTQRDGELLTDPSQYRRLVGRLIYLTITRPDLVYAVHILSQFMDKPRIPYLEAAHKVLRYLKQTPGQGLLLPSKGTLQLRAFCDADWARCKDTRRSITFFFFFFFF